MYTLANSGALRLWTYFCDNKRGLKIGRKLEISEKMYVASQHPPRRRRFSWCALHV